MSLLESIICGIIQGATEFLPVSSSGHLALAHSLFGLEDATATNLSFDILLHLATLIAVFIAYFGDILSLIKAFFTMLGKVFHGKFKLSDYTAEERFTVFVILATLPLALAVIINDYIEALASYCKIVGGILILNGIVLWLGEKLSAGHKNVEDLSGWRAVLIGFCQLCAVLPGLSRSGSTITGGRLNGLSREQAVKFSFILSIPAIIGANIFNVKALAENPIPQSDVPIYLVGMLTAAVCGFAAISLLKWIAKKSTFVYFAYYCVIIGVIAVIFG